MAGSDSGGFLGGMTGGIGKSKAKVYSVEKSTGVTFQDVAGQDEAKESLTGSEFVEMFMGWNVMF